MNEETPKYPREMIRSWKLRKQKHPIRKAVNRLKRPIMDVSLEIKYERYMSQKMRKEIANMK